MSDDIVINTDIDKLIDILSQKKRVEIDDLAKELNIEKKKLKKWLLVLEEEGYLRLEYKLTKIFAVWLLDLGEGSPINLPHMKEDQVKKSAESAIESTLASEISESPFTSSNFESAEAEISNMPPKQREKEKEEEKPKPKKAAKEERKKPESFSSLKAKAAGYSEDVESLKDEISDLEQRKDRIYNIEMPQLEKEASEKVNGIGERMDSLKRHMASLQKSLKDAASAASGMSSKSKTAKALVDEASEVYLGLTNLLTELKQTSKAKGKDLRDEIKSLQDEIMEDQENISTMKESLSGIALMQKDLDKKTIAIRETISSLDKTLEHSADILAGIEERKEDFETRIVEASKILIRKKSELESLNGEVEDIGSLEGKLDSYIKEYMKETDDIRLLVTKAESEIREIEENASQKAIELYLTELGKTAERTEEKMDDMEERSSKMEKEIKEKKARLRKLIGDTKKKAKKGRKK
ncbi:MAG: hypothetical protein NTY68_00095 [Candidatus Micrarchaeota archaeon]|nr:hypothetical protein [Candidatus Micrarchaeota archaeon]